MALLMGMASSSYAAESALDTAGIRALYMDGEFEEAIRKLETARKNRGLKSHADSVFAYKHLGVMYAARYETMEEGKRYMVQLLSIEPAVRIMDMHASDMIYMIFRNVQAEHEIRLARPGNRDTLSRAQPAPQERPHTAQPRKRSSWPYWTAAAVTAAGLGVAAFFLFNEEPPDKYQGRL